MAWNWVWLVSIVRLMSADEAIVVIYLETDLSLKPRYMECVMINRRCRIHPAKKSTATQFDLRNAFVAPPSFARPLLELIGNLTCF